MSKKIYKFFQLLSISLLAFGIVWGLSHLKIFENLESATFDLRQIAFAPPTKASPDIVMIWLDEETMKGLPYRSPVPRDFLTKLNDTLLQAGPKLIAYDIFLKDPSYPEFDATFAESLARGPSLSVMPMRIEYPHKGDGCVDQPLELFRNSLKGIGLADLPFSSFDSVVRHARHEFSTDIGRTPSFAALIFEKATGKSAQKIISDESNWPHIGQLSLTPFTRPSGESFIRFAGPPSKIGGKTNPFKIFPAHLVVKGLVPSAWLEGKIILVGAAFDDLEDAYLTPYFAKFTNYARMNGIEIHSNILSNLLTRRFYYTFWPWQIWAFVALIIIIVSFLATFSSPVKSSFALFGLIIAIGLLAILCFRLWGFVVPIIAPACGAISSFGLGVASRAAIEGRQKRWIKGIFAQYVPATVVEHLIKHPELIKLGGETRRVTSIFTDIASFTSISEHLDPKTLVNLLNGYLSLMNKILFRYGGTIDKYEGDAIIAFFNAPLDIAHHELAAVRAAIDIQSASYEISKKWESTCGRPIVTRIGLNTGEAVVGNMGSNDRFDYTAIGDTINLASRLEGANKFYGTRIIASENTIRGIDNSIIIRPIDKVRVKGKLEAILLYEIMGLHNNPEFDQAKNLSAQFTQAFKKFEGRAIEDAEHLLHDILRIYTEDQPTKELLKRCEKAKDDPSWDLVTELGSK